MIYLSLQSFAAVIILTSWSTVRICQGAILGTPTYGADYHTFSYDPNNPLGPDHWGSIETEGIENSCDGQHNSPIDIPPRPCDKYEDYIFSHGSCDPEHLVYEITPSGLRAQFPYDFTLCDSPRIKIPGAGQTFRGLQFHIHVGSEHSIGERKYAGELHIDHKDPYGDRFAMLAVMIQPDAIEDHPLFAVLLEHWTKHFQLHEEACSTMEGATVAENTTTTATVVTEVSRSSGQTNNARTGGGTRGRRRNDEDGHFGHIYDILPPEATYYLYEGGYTVPPCTEIVWWSVADRPISITPSQYSQIVQMTVNYKDTETCNLGTFASDQGLTSRPLMPLNDRVVQHVCPTSQQGEIIADDAATTRPHQRGMSSWMTMVVTTVVGMTVLSFVW